MGILFPPRGFELNPVVLEVSDCCYDIVDYKIEGYGWNVTISNLRQRNFGHGEQQKGAISAMHVDGYWTLAFNHDKSENVTVKL
jgi:hypothetical protein